MTDRRTRPWAAAGLVALVLVSSCSTSGDAGSKVTTTTSKTAASTTTTKGTSGTDAPSGVIVFDANWPTGPELHAVDLDAVADRRVGGEASGHGPRFSPDGRTLAYTRDATPDADPSDVYVVDLDSSKERKVGPGGCPTWTTDGKALVIYRPDGLQRLELDGTATVIDGGEESCGLEVGPEKYVLWDQDENLELLAAGKRRPLLEAPGCGIGPVDADSGLERIAYTVTCKAKDDLHVGLWVMDLSTGDAERIMKGDVYGAAWSPDDQWVATTLGAELKDGTARHDLWIACVDTCDQRKIYEGGVNSPTWGPAR